MRFTEENPDKPRLPVAGCMHDESRSGGFTMVNDFFANRMQRQLGREEAARFLQSLCEPAPVSIRLHPLKPYTARGNPVPWHSNGIYLDERPVFTLDPAFHAGAYYVQEASSMLTGHVVEQLAERMSIRTVLDACASPGGKTTLLASALPGSFIVANEVIRSRLPSLTENVMKWGTGNIAVTASETGRFSALPTFFDVILADVPCSGEGLFRKQSEWQREWTEENARHCTLRQRRILMELWPALRPGGFLVYSTCTFNPEENELNLKWLRSQTGAGAESGAETGIDEGADYDSHSYSAPDNRVGINDLAGSHQGVESIPLEMPDGWGVSEITTDGITGYACYPHRVEGEGFFIAVIRKPVNALEPDTARNAGKRKSVRKPAIPFEHVPADITARLNNWFTGGDHQFIRYGKMIHRINPSSMPFLEQLHLAMPVRYAGIEVAETIRDELKPAHAAALCPFLNHGHFQTRDLAEEQALAFLRSEALPNSGDEPVENGKKQGSGWILARHNGLGLGWLKHAGNRLNNYYPRSWRIRMK
jgi:16S rRNA C967 or C1407 C5-methylase (RsmB/RsmF family)/NOL1/NOP2/fmu family ribosome biogenesis protein